MRSSVPDRRALRSAVCVCERAKPFKLTAKFVSSHREMECLPWAGCWQDTRNERAVKIESVMQFRSVCAGEMDIIGPLHTVSYHR